MSVLLIGNIISFIGALVMVATGLIKTKKKILITQCFQYGIMGIGNLILGGITGCIANVVSILRNIVGCKIDLTLPLKIFFIIIQIIPTYFLNNMGIVGWLPTFAACIFTFFLDTKNEIVIKLLIILSQIMWGIFDFTISNFAGLTFDILTIITNFIGIFMVKKNKVEDYGTESKSEL